MFIHICVYQLDWIGLDLERLLAKSIEVLAPPAKQPVNLNTQHRCKEEATIINF